MSLRDVIKDVQGYQELQQDVEILQRYGVDYANRPSHYAQVIESLHPRRLRLIISEIIEETRSARTIRLIAAERHLPPFLAGQYINLFVDVGGIRTSRPYSIASAPNQIGYYDITVRRVEDGFVSNYLLDEVKVGDVLETSGPAGNFNHNPLYHSDEVVFLAGGCGITPLMSMLREVTDRGLPRRIHLIYGCRNSDDIIYRAELEQRAARHANLRCDIVISEPAAGYQGLTGFISRALIRERVGDLSRKTFFICGPDVMYTFCLDELAALGIPRRRIRNEVFGPPKDVTAQPGWPQAVKADAHFQVKIKGRQVIEARAAEPLMISLERAKIVIPALCRSGECSLCRTKLLTGKVYQPQGVKLRRSDRQYGYIHPCMTYPLSDLEIQI